MGNGKMAEIQESTSSEHLMEHVKNIAQWVRLSGSEEEGKSFAYIEQLEELRLAKDEYDDGNFAGG
ncbi:MAG: hypothetical protein ACYCVD_19990 [Desulfitobacteriaceae bacterium]